MKNHSKINLVQDALHGMAYYIFLKSLRSLQEFRKNSHVKIPPKSPSTIFQILAIIKNQILFRKENFLHFRPNRPSGQPAHPASQPSQPHRPPFFFCKPRVRSAHPGLRSLGVFAKRSLFFEFAQPGDDAFSLCHRHAGPACRLRRLPRAGRPRSEFLHAAAPPRRCPTPRMPSSFYNPPSSLSPLNPLQTER
jgi:hypothetical protein